MGRVHVSMESFVRACHEVATGGGNHADVAKRLNLKPTSVQNRFSRYRKLGANLPKFPRAAGAARFDVEAANALIKELDADTPEVETSDS